MAAVELRLLCRDPVGIGFSLVFPALLLAVLGAFYPGFTDVAPGFGGIRPVDAYVPVTAVLSLIMLGILTLPSVLASYRERGVLRRLRVTPLGPGRLLAAVLLVDLLVGVAAVGLVLLVARVGFDAHLPRSPGWFALALLLGSAAMLALGLVIASVAGRGSVAAALGQVVFFPAMFLSGVWYPRELMSGWLLTVSDLSPVGAFVQALGESWAGRVPGWQPLLVLAVWALATSLLARRLFRWE
ncbi:ABC transporter permease [Thalassiella azotivora]